jgi:PBP1b-binding outer membrane lipoprotein LpoB
MKLRATLATIALAIVLAGCSQNPKPVVGAANQFDSDTYLTLVTTDSVIQATKAALMNNQFPAGFVPNVKTALNHLIDAYNAADTVYQTYHTAALVGQSTPVQQAAVNTAMGNVQAATTILIAAKAGQL